MVNNLLNKHHILYIVVFLIVFSFISTAFVSALTYQQEIGVNFTFNPTLNLTVSADLYINNLAPNTASDSNIINVNVSTNAVTGYTLAATVGNNTTYNTRNLIHSNTSLSNNFASIAYSATPTVTTNTNLSSDTWAFSYSVNNGSTWSNYNGLPLYSDTTNVALLKETNGPVSSANGDDIKFKIAAKASETQASGEYNNVINFNLAAKVVPQYTVEFNANGGSGTMPDQTIFRDEATMLAPISLTPPANKIFSGWNTAADGSGTSYTNQQSVTNIAADGGTITLYAQWQARLYDMVASMSKGKQTLADLQSSSGSGVYEYDASVFGVASDASNNYSIYYYRGVLDNSFAANQEYDGEYYNIGSSGNGGRYPNYVKLGNTCWRIVRTTGSGGVKMIYNGIWSNNTCAHAKKNATTGTAVTISSRAYSMAEVGYTFNSAALTANEMSLGTILGSNSNITVNSARSGLKVYLEDTWYASNMTDYTNILESSAGYCSDRTAYDEQGILQDESVTTRPFYASLPTNANADIYYFGSYYRYNQTPKKPTLSCSRGNVDLYHYIPNSDGLYNELKYPVALLTMDEYYFAGIDSYRSSGKYLYTGDNFWLLSPYSRNSSGYSSVYSGSYYGQDGRGTSSTNIYVRPVVSIVHDTFPASGSGTATDPWVISAPSN